MYEIKKVNESDFEYVPTNADIPPLDDNDIPY